MRRRLGRIRDVHDTPGSVLVGPNWRTRFRLSWRGRRDARAGIPVPDSESWSTPAMVEIEKLAARSHHAIAATTIAEITDLDAEIAVCDVAIDQLRDRLAAAESTAENAAEAADALGAPRGSDDAAARARRRAAAARASVAADRHRLDGLRERRAGLHTRRDLIIRRSREQARAVSSFCEQCLEAYRAANLRRRDGDAPALHDRWPRPAIADPSWLVEIDRPDRADGVR